ncbi:hypothetical protein [Halolamina rubra]|uniref:hypothetical protein n=1 Tax=Halolamina rubra TaxID=1380430 RepID=UPI000679DEE6|nr:hypothetical protein [Halolamina rubra]
MEHVDDAHSSVQNALQAVASLELGSLNETEREHAGAAILHLRDLDEALAQRSAIDAEQLGMGVPGNRRELETGPHEHEVEADA